LYKLFKFWSFLQSKPVMQTASSPRQLPGLVPETLWVIASQMKISGSGTDPKTVD